jgi:hypothetical protein
MIEKLKAELEFIKLHPLMGLVYLITIATIIYLILHPEP